MAQLPHGAHPVTVRDFMTTSTSALAAVDAVEMSPTQWLAGGGDPTSVIEMAFTLGEQV